MLILTRKQYESVMVGDVKVTVKRVYGHKVQLSFEGPREVNIVRLEALERQRESRSDSKD